MVKITPDLATVERETRDWIERIVVGLGLCPFAGAPLADDALEIVAGRFDVQSCLERLAGEGARLVERHATGTHDATTVLVLAPWEDDGTTGFDDFDDYLDLAAIADDLLDDLDWRGVLQLATFHPDYLFEDSDADDPANASNRSPYPMLHLLVEDSVAAAIDSHPDPEGIPGRNIERLRALGNEALDRIAGGTARGEDDG